MSSMRVFVTWISRIPIYVRYICKGIFNLIAEKTQENCILMNHMKKFSACMRGFENRI